VIGTRPPLPEGSDRTSRGVDPSHRGPALDL
jgi:hypothetical protein